MNRSYEPFVSFIHLGIQSVTTLKADVNDKYPTKPAPSRLLSQFQYLFYFVSALIYTHKEHISQFYKKQLNILFNSIFFKKIRNSAK